MARRFHATTTLMVNSPDGLQGIAASHLNQLLLLPGRVPRQRSFLLRNRYVHTARDVATQCASATLSILSGITVDGLPVTVLTKMRLV